MSINLLHIRVTEGFPTLNAWAIRSFYFIILCWAYVLISLTASCVPFSRRWNGLVGIEKPCKPVVRAWDFWTHMALHVTTDIWLCILPFPAIAQIRTRPKLRAAVFFIYGLAFSSVIATIIRATLLGLSASDNVVFIHLLSMIELAMLIIIAALPSISAAFNRRFMTEVNSSYVLHRVKVVDRNNRRPFSELQDQEADNNKRNVSTQSASSSTREINRECDEVEPVARSDGQTQSIF
ncbi:hypothetical protein P154DRAFT_518615 [Amniculicola lignicola CBS 123094]|uniref:Rhodopsin domain-containing protein n=1 Tax=Amniculicola lignicola CBS 123094 TaxID=1392246 RepID=A0A6A5WUP2_9PLEO|nr:hypothetical protein P154DRAFT_518615 [Amniculicola lignicola CBS 123094]